MRWETKVRSAGWCSTPRPLSAFALTALAFAILAATVVRPPATPGPFARDFEAYYAAGATWNDGGDPWSRDVWRVERTLPGIDASRDELLPFAGPAVSLPLWSLLARMPFETARLVWIAVLTAALIALALAATALAGARLTPAAAANVLLFAALTGNAISAVGLGQVALLAAAGVALALLALERRSAWASVAALVAGLQPNLAIVLAVRLTGRRSLPLLAAAAATFFALTFAIGGGAGGFAVYLQRLGALGAAERFDVIQYGVPAVLASFGVAHGSAAFAGVVCEAIAVLLAAAGAWRWRAQPRFAALLAIALLPWAVPFFHEHDFVLELLPVIALAGAAQARVRVPAAIAAMCVSIDWLGLAQRPGGAAHEACLIVAAACAFAALPSRAPDGATPWPAFVTAALLALVAFPLALNYPAPVWPDMLGTFHAAPALDAAGMWAAEQARAGLTGVLPATGLLRAIPLFGCLVLALAAYRAAEPAAITMRLPRTASGTAVSDSPSHGPAVQ